MPSLYSTKQPRGLLVFAKSPTPGKVKTRLMQGMSATQAATIYEQLLTHTLREAQASNATPTVWRDGDREHPFWQASPHTVFKEQPAGHLGDKLAGAVTEAFTQHQHVVVVGSDCLALNAAYINAAFDALAAGHDVVVGPATDGGYVLIGMAQCYTALFEDIAWSTPRVCEQTLTQAKLLKLRVFRLTSLTDIDTPEDAILAGLFSCS